MTYQAVTTVLQRHDADMGAAEAHGIACGMLCVALDADAANWLHEICHDEYQLPDDDKSLLVNLFERTRDLLAPEDEEFVFDLFLPDDDEPLSVQVEALRCWCQGFLFGVGYLHSDQEWPGETDEIMRDLIELTKIDTEVNGEDDENALVEIREYLRSAILIVRDQFSEFVSSQTH